MRKRGNIWYITDASGRRVSSGTSDYEAAKALQAKHGKERWARRHMPELYRELDARPKKTLGQACEKWLEEHANNQGYDANERWFAFWIEAYGHGCLLNEINRDNAHEIIKHRTTEEPSKANNTANNYVGALKKVLISAATRYHRHDDPWYVGETPHFRSYPTPSSRSRVLCLEEWTHLAGVLEPDLRAMALFSLSTLLRETNVFTVSPAHIRDSVAYFHAEEMKKRRPHSVPLNRTAWGAIAEALGHNIVPIGNAPIFTFHGKPLQHLTGSAYTAWKAGIKAAGIEPLTFHDLRRTGASWLASAGVPEEIRMRLGAWHRKGVMQEFYTQFETEKLRPHIAVIDRILAEDNVIKFREA